MDIDTRIKINTTDKRHYYSITLLVDKPEFIEWVLDLRKKWKIKKLFSPTNYISFYSHIREASNKNWELFQKDIERVRTAFGRLPNFDEVIMYAIAFTEVPDGAYKSCYAETIVDPSDPNDESKYKYAIIISPDTSTKDVSKVLNELKKKIKAGLKQKKDPKVMQEAVANYKFELGPNYTPTPRVMGNIIRDREWYWLKQNHSYAQVHKIAQEDGYKISKDGVVKAIVAYTERLSEDITLTTSL